MTFEELKKHATENGTENGTQAGVLVSSLAAAMVERGDSDERLLNLVETAKEQGSQGGASLIELLDVMYDLGYDEDILDELWEGCSQQGNQSGPLVAPTADIAAESPGPIFVGTQSVTFKSLGETQGTTTATLNVYKVGDAIITLDFLKRLTYDNNIEKGSIAKNPINARYHSASINGIVVEHSTTYEYFYDSSVGYAPINNKAFALQANGSFIVVLVYPYTLSPSIGVMRASVIDFNGPAMGDVTVHATDTKDTGVIYIDL